ncbi:alpha/beta fold hydrolase [Gordonia sp. SID5947]|uniref:alpha/beta fold hydrolase n=1 Tax=Gordonia sp. SID5947 TaxID=2690315 RepID=UPI0013709BE9|nr:alpha/beta hydrolase [Gordonia sp. SID5947]MYR07243.1 alpha/beta fold hydrolase [Gordonia sp. SID5947]
MSRPLTQPEQTSFTGVDGIALRADEWRPVGAQVGPTIILLHGGGQTRHSWKQTGQLLANAGAHVVSLDTRGHGTSDWSSDGRYSLELFTGDVVEVVEQIGTPVTLVGASMGGLSSIGAAAQLGPDKARGLVLVDVVPRFDQAGSARIRDFMTANVGGFDTLEDAADAIAAYLPHRPKTFNPEGLKRNLRAGQDGRWYWHWDPAFVRSKPGDDRFVRAEHLEEQLASLSVPILLIRGKLSDVVPEEAVAGFREVVPAAEVIELADAAHTAAADDNDAFTHVVLDFIGAHR